MEEDCRSGKNRLVMQLPKSMGKRKECVYKGRQTLGGEKPEEKSSSVSLLFKILRPAGFFNTRGHEQKTHKLCVRVHVSERESEWLILSNRSHQKLGTPKETKNVIGVVRTLNPANKSVGYSGKRGWHISRAHCSPKGLAWYGWGRVPSPLAMPFPHESIHLLTFALP